MAEFLNAGHKGNYYKSGKWTIKLSASHSRAHTQAEEKHFTSSFHSGRSVTWLTTQLKEKCSAGSNTDWQAYRYYWRSYVSQWKKEGKKDRMAFDADECRVSALTPLQRPASTDPSRDSTGPDVARLTPQITFPIHLWKLPSFTEVAFGLLAPAWKQASADLKYHAGWQAIRASPRNYWWKSGREKKRQIGGKNDFSCRMFLNSFIFMNWFIHHIVIRGQRRASSLSQHALSERQGKQPGHSCCLSQSTQRDWQTVSHLREFYSV